MAGYGDLIGRMLNLVWRAVPDLVRTVSYVQPVGLNRYSGIFVWTEVVVECSVLVGRVRLSEWAPAAVAAGTERLMVRASELAGVSNVGAGDQVVENSTGLVWRIVGASLEGAGKFWRLQVERRGDEYWGDLVGAVAASEDWGDLGAVTVVNDWLGLE